MRDFSPKLLSPDGSTPQGLPAAQVAGEAAAPAGAEGKPPPFEAELERRVAERTAELQATIANLQRQISERERSDERVEWLASFPEQNPNPIAEFERESGALRYANPSAIRLLPELRRVGLNHAWLAPIREMSRGWTECPCETVRLEAAFGESFYLLTVTCLAEGQRVRLYGIDITARKLAEEARARLSEIVRSSSDAIIGKSLDGIITTWNAGAEKIFGYTEEEAVGKPMLMLFPPERVPEEAEILARIARDETVPHFDTQRICKDGRRIDVSVTISPVHDSGGRIVGASKIARDITEQKRAEKALRENEERFRAYVEQASDSMFVHDYSGRFLEVNRQACVSLGYSREELLRMSVFDVETDFDLAKAQTVWTAIQPDQATTLVGHQRRKDGSVFPVEVRFGCFDMDGQRRYLGLVRNLTERVNAERALREKDALLHATDRRLAEIVQGMTEACFALDTDWRFTFVNDRSETLFRHRREKMLGRTIWEVFSKLVGTPMEANYRRAMTERVPVAFEVFSPIAERWLDIRLFPTGEGIAAFLLDIQARKETEESLRMLGSAVEQAKESIVITDTAIDLPGPRILFVNPAFTRMTGYTAEEVIGKTPRILQGPRTDRGVLSRLRKCLEMGEVFEGEAINYRKDGKEFYMEWQIAPIRNAGGNITHFVAIQRDITERKRAEDALQESEERFRTMANSIPQLAWIARADGYIVWYNGRWYAYTGTTAEQMEGWGWQSVHDPEALPKVMESWQSAIESTEPFEMEFPLRGADGQFRTFLTRVQPLKDAEGQVVQWFGTNTDVDELKRVEESLRTAQTRLNSTLAAGSVGTWTWDIVHDCLVADEFTAGVFSIEPDAAAKGLPAETYLQAVMEKDRPSVADGLARAIESCGHYDIEYRVRQKDGTFRWLQAKGRVEGDAAGKAVNFHGAVMDITARKLAEEEVHRLNVELEQRVIERTAQLEAANKELEAFSYSVSHDLRSPLRAIDGFSQALAEDYGPQLPEEAQEHIQTIRAGAQRMGALIDDLLTFSRLSRSPLARREVETSRLVRMALEDLRFQQEGRALEVRCDPLPDCEGDPALLKQVWLNLLSNAFKYTLKCPAAVVEIGSLEKDGETIYFVRDNGAGFDMRYAGKLFGVFQRLHRAEDYAGTGVGLAIVQRVIHRHGGRVWAESAVNRGATFFFTLHQGELP